MFMNMEFFCNFACRFNCKMSDPPLMFDGIHAQANVEVAFSLSLKFINCQVFLQNMTNHIKRDISEKETLITIEVRGKILFTFVTDCL